MKIIKTYLFLVVSLLWFTSNSQNPTSDINVKDTLFFELDKGYFQKDRYDENFLHIVDALVDQGSSEIFLFKIMDKRSDIAPPKNINGFPQYIRRLGFFSGEKKTNKLKDYDLASHLKKYIIYLVDNDCKPPNYLKVYPLTQIE